MCSGTSLKYKIMCFVVDKDNTKVQIADKDIVCWKHGHLDGKEFVSEYRCYRYKKGALNVSPFLKNEKYKTDSALSQGFHSYSKMLPTENFFEHSLRLKKFIIPKGSRYLINPDRDEYISNQIIMNESKRTNRKNTTSVLRGHEGV